MGHQDEVTFVISVAAQLAGMHPQTLRQYDRIGLVTPLRTKGRGRRYTRRDVERLKEIQRLSQEEGINLAGIQRIMELEDEVDRLREQRDALAERVEEFEPVFDRVFVASPDGQIRPMRRAHVRRAEESRRGGMVPVRDRGLVAWRSAGNQRVRALIEASPEGVRVIEGTVVVSR